MAADTIDAVIAQMTAIDGALEPTDGVACFNRMYLRVTLAVRDAVSTTTFENGEFLSRLDVIFAGRFFDAYDADRRGDRVHAAWAPLFAQRDRPHTFPLQFALAGMNAHINFDLPVSVVATCHEMGLEPQAGSSEHRDFTRVNDVLDQVDEIIRGEFSTATMRTIDEALGHVDDSMQMWCISAARGVAWNVAETLWALHGRNGPRDLFLGALGQSVAMASRGLLF